MRKMKRLVCSIMVLIISLNCFQFTFADTALKALPYGGEADADAYQNKPEEFLEVPRIEKTIEEQGTISPNLYIVNSDASVLESDTHGYVDISLAASTETSVTLDLWFENSDDSNKLLKMYDDYEQEWTTLLGGKGNPPASSQRYTVSNLHKAAYYTFAVWDYNRDAGFWEKEELQVETEGEVVPFLKITDMTPTSITYQVQFPSEYQWTNRVQYFYSYTSERQSYPRQGLYAKSGSYTITDLQPGMLIGFDGGTLILIL